jgi:hypothetical protein
MQISTRVGVVQAMVFFPSLFELTQGKSAWARAQDRSLQRRKRKRGVEGPSGVEVPERHLHKKKTGPSRVRFAEFVGAGPTITFQRGTADD